MGMNEVRKSRVYGVSRHIISNKRFFLSSIELSSVLLCMDADLSVMVG